MTPNLAKVPDLPPGRPKLRKPALPLDFAAAEARAAAGQTPRCEWAQRNPDLTAYHDDIWGERPRDDSEWFERMMFEIFHAGLSWTLVWNKRQGLRRAYAGFDIESVANFGPTDIERLMQDPDVVRSRRKVDAAIENARRSLDLRDTHGSLESFLLGMPSSQEAKQSELKKAFAFMGPGVARSFVEATGLVVPPHHPYCFKADRPVWSAAG